MKFPAYGVGLWNKRLMGERIRVVALMVGNRWKLPKQYPIPADVPKLAVKTAPWHTLKAERYDWRLVVDCTVLAFDTRGPDEREEGTDDWDPWLWLLADAQRYARDVLLFTPTIEFHDPKGGFAPERDLGTYAWCNCSWVDGVRVYPPWWPYGSTIRERDRLAEAAA